MTETTDNEELAAELEDLEQTTVDADGEDLRAQVEAQLAKWRQWIDELVVQADLGRLDVRDELKDLVQRVENSYLALKNEAEKAIDRNQGKTRARMRPHGLGARLYGPRALRLLGDGSGLGNTAVGRLLGSTWLGLGS